MRKHLVITIIVVLLSIALPLSASYPSLTPQYEGGVEELPTLDQDVLEGLEAFIEEWQDLSGPTFTEADQALRIALKQGNLNLEQLQSLYRMQEEQLAFQKREQGFKVGLTSQPLYALGRSINRGAGGVVTFDTNHTLGVSASVSKKLGTGGSATLSTKHISISSLNSAPNSSWKWTHSPSVKLSVDQPLFLGEGFLDTKYSANQMGKQNIAVENSLLSVDQLTSGLVAQGNGLLSALQALLEGRYVLGEQIVLERTSLEEAKKDRDAGRISENTYKAKTLFLDQLHFSLSEIERQIRGIESSLALLWGEKEYPKQVILDPGLVSVVSKLSLDKNMVIATILKQDPAYRIAANKLESARLDIKLKNPADAPRVNLSLEYNPILDPSYEPIFSVSIGFSASDLFRSTSKLSATLAAEGVLQAEKEVEKAKQDIETKVDETMRSIEGLTLNLAIGLHDFALKTNAYEVEEIRYSFELANANSLRVKKLAWYEAAFTVLQTLRELNLIALELQSSGVKL